MRQTRFSLSFASVTPPRFGLSRRSRHGMKEILERRQAVDEVKGTTVMQRSTLREQPFVSPFLPSAKVVGKQASVPCHWLQQHQLDQGW